MFCSFYLATSVALLSCFVQAQDFEPRIFAPRPRQQEFYNVTSTVPYTGGSSQETVTATNSVNDGLGTSAKDTYTPMVPVDTLPATTVASVSSTSDLMHASPSVDNSTSANLPGPSAHDTSRPSSEDPQSTIQGTNTAYPHVTSTDGSETSIIAPSTSATGGYFSSSIQTTSLAPNSSVEVSSSTVPVVETSPASSSTPFAITSVETTPVPASGYTPSGTSSTVVDSNTTSTSSESRYAPTGTSPATSLPSFSGTGTSISSLSSKTSDVEESTETSNPTTTSVDARPSVSSSTTTQNATRSTRIDPNPESTSVGKLPLTGTSTATEETSGFTTIIPTSSSYVIPPTSANYTLSSTSKSAAPNDPSSSDLSSTSSDTAPSTYTPAVSSTRIPTASNQTSTSLSQTSTLPASASRTPTADPTTSNETVPYTSVYQSSSETSAPSIIPVIPITSNGTTSYTTQSPSTSSPSQSLAPSNSNTTYNIDPTGSLVSPTSSLSSNYPSLTQSSIQKSDSATSTTPAPTVILPTSTNSHSTFIPSSIIAQTSASHVSDESTTTSLQTGIPSALPKIVQNPLSSSTPAQPVDTTEVQIGFQWALNYPFVVSHPLSTSQIFTYLPIGIADGLGLKPEQITVKNLLPLDTTAELHFITTVARIFLPTSMVDTLRVDLGIPVSPIYQNPDESINTLMNYINPAIPFFPGPIMDPGSYPSSTDTHVRPSPSDNNGVFNTGSQQSQSSGAKGTTAGIALAAFGGAAAYGAAMFLLARRYKHRKQLRIRAASISNTVGTGEYGSPITPSFGDGGALMSGGRSSPSHDLHSRGSGRTGNTARTAQISAPMMSENSLGWN